MPQKLVFKNLFRNHNQNKLTQPTKTNIENLSFILVFHCGMSTIKVYFDYFVSGRVKWVPSSKLKCFDVFRPLVFLMPFCRHPFIKLVTKKRLVWVQLIYKSCTR